MTTLAGKAKITRRWRKKRKWRPIEESVRVFRKVQILDLGMTVFKRRRENILKYGKRFLTTFPDIEIPGMKRKKFVISVSQDVSGGSTVGVAISLVDVAKKQQEKNSFPLIIASANLSFGSNSVKVVELRNSQTKKQILKKSKGDSWLDRFKARTGVYWADYLLKKIEVHAKKTGFKEVRIMGEIGFPRKSFEEEMRITTFHWNTASKNMYSPFRDYYRKIL